MSEDPSGDTPLFCTKCRKKVQHQGHCPKGGNHHLISISDKGVQGQGKDDGPESNRNNQETDPHKIGTRVGAATDRIRAYALQYLAHDSGDGQTVYHCPFCGGGNVIGRSDGTIECGFCNTHFTVQVQPEFAGMPQTIDGQPYDVPGMPGGVDPMTGQPPMMDDGSEMGDDEEMPPEGPPGDADMGSPEDEEAQGKNGTSVPWEHQSARRRYASRVGEMTEDQYMAHLALVHIALVDVRV
jgi:ribosomal protein L37AE/L43A